MFVIYKIYDTALLLNMLSRCNICQLVWFRLDQKPHQILQQRASFEDFTQLPSSEVGWCICERLFSECHWNASIRLILFARSSPTEYQ